MAVGYVSLILHAHLPYIRHPEYPQFFEERWLFEAINECYLPLIGVFDRLLNDGVSFRVAFSLSPTLTALLEDDLLQRRHIEHTARMVDIAEREVHRLRHDARFHPLAVAYRDYFREAQRLFETRCRRRVAAVFREFAEAGVIEPLAGAATHAYLPLWKGHATTVRAQLAVGAAEARIQWGVSPRGGWLPECGFFPGLECELAAHGWRYFIVESHGLLRASSRPIHGVHAPIACPNGVAAFARDPECSAQVWSAEIGYPGDPVYREFHVDAGHEIDPTLLAEWLPGAAGPTPIGLRYYRVTDRRGGRKEPYRPAAAAARTEEHADDFVRKRLAQLEGLAPAMDLPPIVVAPFDAELFGHWWYEGPRWLEGVIRRLAQIPAIALATPGDYLEQHDRLQCAVPAESSWGRGGAHATWLEGGADYLQPRLRAAAEEMSALARDFKTAPPGSLTGRAARQAARSLMLAQASDWPFLISTGAAAHFAKKTLRDHLARFHYLHTALRASAVDERRLQAIELLDAVFPELELAVWE